MNGSNSSYSRSRSISLSSVEQLLPGQKPSPLLPGAPSYPPSNLYENPLPGDRVRSRPNSIIGSSSSNYAGDLGSVRIQEGSWSSSGENAVKRHSTSIIPTTSYHPIPALVNPHYYSNHTPAQYISHLPAVIASNQGPPQKQQQPTLSSVELQYHQQLVQYYLGYARQGRLAPITNERQERARIEAIAWARSEGIQLADPTIIHSPVVPQYVIPANQYQTTSAITPIRNPLPLINTTTISISTPISNTSPSAYLNRSTSLATATTTLPSTMGLARSSSAAQPSTSNTPYSSNPPSPTKRPLPIPPSRSSTLPQPLPSSITTTTTTTTTTRPLPQPSGSKLPLEQLANLNLNGKGISLTREGAERRNSVPIPSFSFGTSDDTISSTEISTPSFNITPSDSSTRSSPSISISSLPSPSSFSNSRNSSTTSAHIHPRLDPNHPSHYLYHPTSTNSQNTSSQANQKISAGTIVCTRCKVQMFGRALMAMGKEWHPECFICSKEGCGVALEHVQFDGKGGEDDEVYCMVHYEELYAAKCYQCKTPIAAEEYVLVSDPLLLPPAPRTYHALHFFCSSCGDPFVDPKSLAKGKEGTLAAPFMVEKGFAYCQACDLKMFRPKCTGCKKGIGGEWVEVEGKMWHVECFTCCRCDKPLTGDYLVRADDEDSDGELPYCIQCYNIKARNE